MSSGKKNKVYWYEFGTTCNTLIDFLDSSISIHIHEKAKLIGLKKFIHVMIMFSNKISFQGRRTAFGIRTVERSNT